MEHFPKIKINRLRKNSFRLMPISFIPGTILLLWLVLFSAASCRQTALPEGISFMPLDSTSAAQAILRDTVDGYFEMVSGFDKLLQTGGDSTIVFDTFLAGEGMPWPEKEWRKAEKCMRSALQTIAKKYHGWSTPPVGLILSRGRQYGEHTYYTREANIVIPLADLRSGTLNEVTTVLQHELFHIYSRYHQNQRPDWYSRLGFQTDTSIQIPQTLLDQRLYNPDGLSIYETIQLDSLEVLPFLYADCSAGNYMSCFAFDLFQVERDSSGVHLVTNKNGGSTLGPEWMQKFRVHMGDFTDYLIHPEEILAEYFVLSLAAKPEDLPETARAFLEGWEID